MENDGNSSERQMSTSDLMQTDADAMPDPYTMQDRDGTSDAAYGGGGTASGLDGYKPGQYL